MHLPGTWKEWSELAQTAAIAGAVIYIFLRVVFGYFMINLSIEPNVQRFRGKDRKTDDLLLTLKLTKGDREAANLSKVVITPIPVVGCKEGENYPEHTFTNPIGGRRFKLSPGETAVFSYHIETPSEAVCKIKIEVFGGSGFRGWPSSYWMVSTVSLPRQETRESQQLIQSNASTASEKPESAT